MRTAQGTEPGLQLPPSLSFFVMQTMEFTLRKFQPEDVPALVRYYDNRNVSRYLTDAFPFPYGEEDARAFIGSVAADDLVQVFAIDVDGEAVGSIGIFPGTDVHRCNAEIGYCLAEPFWGRGIMTAAIGRVCDYGFATFGVDRIFARPFGVNSASHRVLEKAGFTLEARFSGTIVKDDVRYDELYYAIRR